MGFVRTEESRRAEIDEFRQMLLSCAGVVRKVRSEDLSEHKRATAGDKNDDARERKLVCVTSGVSFLGIAIVKQLLLRGFAVRVIVDNEEDIDRLRETEILGEIVGTSLTKDILAGVFVANFSDREKLMEAFDGCYGVFHTAAFIDPSGLSGYSKSMAEIEARAAENVAEACAATPSVRSYVLTSSLLTCVWRDASNCGLTPIVDHNNWSDESYCNDKKLWYALGKSKAERASWRIAEERGLKMATICSGLVTGPQYYNRNPSSTIAYLKGAQDMYQNGLLATVNVDKLAKAHVCVFEEMHKTASGRYLCFDKVVRGEEEVERLAQETGIFINAVSTNESGNSRFRFELSNRKLARLMATTYRCSYTN